MVFSDVIEIEWANTFFFKLTKIWPLKIIVVVKMRDNNGKAPVVPWNYRIFTGKNTVSLAEV